MFSCIYSLILWHVMNDVSHMHLHFLLKFRVNFIYNLLKYRAGCVSDFWWYLIFISVSSYRSINYHNQFSSMLTTFFSEFIYKTRCIWYKKCKYYRLLSTKYYNYLYTHYTYVHNLANIKLDFFLNWHNKIIVKFYEVTMVSFRGCPLSYDAM